MNSSHTSSGLQLNNPPSSNLSASQQHSLNSHTPTPVGSSHRLNSSASALPMQQSPRSRRSSVPARPAQVKPPSSQAPPPRSQLNLTTTSSAVGTSSHSQLAQVPPSPMDAAPKQMAPSRPNTQYDVLPPMTGAVCPPAAAQMGATYDTLPKPSSAGKGGKAPNLIYDHPPTGKRVTNYDVLPPPPPLVHAPPAPAHPRIPSSPAPTVKPSPTDYDLLPSSSPGPPSITTTAPIKPKTLSTSSYGYDQLPPVVPDTPGAPAPKPSFSPSTTSPASSANTPSSIPGKRRPPMLSHKSVPLVPTPVQTPLQTGYINLSSSPKKTPGFYKF